MIDTAIVTAAGYGTRFLPATKNIPKEMLPILDVPILHEVVRECVDAGISKIIIVTRHGNYAVEDYFDNNKELEDYLHDLGKIDRYDRFSEVFDRADYAYVRQHKSLPYGNGSPILAAKPYLTPGKTFCTLFGDDLVHAKRSAIGQMIEEYEKLASAGANPVGMLAAQQVAESQVSKYGIVKYRDEARKILGQLVEKPKIGEHPSTLASYGRYILSYDIFNYLDEKKTGQGNELWLVDSICQLAQQGDFYVKQVEGTWYTTGDPANLLKATIAYALEREDMREDVLQAMKDLLIVQSREHTSSNL